tara:strand:- start:704 stop:1174 length:471 start_codon:yes stop_codon:yes gene_type:complete
MNAATNNTTEATIADLNNAIADLKEHGRIAIPLIRQALKKGVRGEFLLDFLGMGLLGEEYDGHRADAGMLMRSTRTHLTPDNWTIGGRYQDANKLRFDALMMCRILDTVAMGFWRGVGCAETIPSMIMAHEAAQDIVRLSDALGVTICPRFGTVNK